MNFKEFYEADLSRYQTIDKYNKKWHKYFRKAQFTANPILKKIYRFKLAKLSMKNGVGILWRVKVGKGLFLCHPYCINVNDDTVLGENVNLHKGVTIGQENRGQRKGCPTIGNEVWIGVNATIVGKINIGDDVLIAPNSFVNVDVPSHSIVFGNPCQIHHKDEATKDYINRAYK